MKKKHIIIGASAAGMGVLLKLRQLAPDDEIVCIAAQDEMPFNTCLLANYLSTGTMQKTLYTKPESFFTRNNITLKLGTLISSIRPKEQKISDYSGSHYNYDTLFIGIGTQARTIKTDFTPKSGYFQFHTLRDTIAIDHFIKTRHPRSAIVIGAGLSGIECADALTERGISVTVVDPATHPLAMLLIKPAGDMLDLMMKRVGATFYSGIKVTEILVEPFTGAAAGVVLDSDIELYSDMVVCAIGATSNLELGMQAGAFLVSGGILVNRHMQLHKSTTLFAGGDVATVPTPQHTDDQPILNYNTQRSCTWPDAMHQGIIAAHAMAGTPILYPGVTVTPSSQFFGTHIISSGNMQHKNEETHGCIIYQGENWYHYFIIDEDNRLKGFFMLGNVRNVGLYRKLLASQEPCNVAILDPLNAFETEKESLDE